MGVEDLQVEGPTIDSRPQELSIGKTNDHSVYQAVVVMPGGVGAALWNSIEFDESMNRPYGEPFDLAPRFVEFDQCPFCRQGALRHARLAHGHVPGGERPAAFKRQTADPAISARSGISRR